MNKSMCQLEGLPQATAPLGLTEIAWQFRNRLKRFLKRRWHFVLWHWRHKTGVSSKKVDIGALTVPASLGLQAGERVRVKSMEQIRDTLDGWGALKGCVFMEEMARYCGTEQMVRKCVQKFLDERTYQIKTCKHLVALEGVYCEGTVDFGPCDRSCFFFWREEWLEKI